MFSLKNRNIQLISIIIFRIILSLVWILGSITKINNIDNYIQSVLNYKIVSYSIAYPIGHIIPILELLLGTSFILGIYMNITGIISSILLLLFTIAIISLWYRGIYINCGCFSVSNTKYNNAYDSKYPLDIARDVGLIIISLYVAFFKKHKLTISNLIK